MEGKRTHEKERFLRPGEFFGVESQFSGSVDSEQERAVGLEERDGETVVTEARFPCRLPGNRESGFERSCRELRQFDAVPLGYCERLFLDRYEKRPLPEKFHGAGIRRVGSEEIVGGSDFRHFGRDEKSGKPGNPEIRFRKTTSMGEAHAGGAPGIPFHPAVCRKPPDGPACRNVRKRITGSQHCDSNSPNSNSSSS